jgi:cell division transport system ATP-binding protein
MIMFSDVSKKYDREEILKDISLTIGKGEMTFITGPSGAGKTTLLKLIYCSERPDSGQIVVGDWTVTKLKQKEIPFLRRNIGVVFQDFRLLENLTVFDNVALSLQINGVGQREVRESVNYVLREVKMNHKANIYPPYLSGGEQQRVVIARAMVTKPAVLLADEPTGNLDAENTEVVMRLFREINSRGTTVLIATHNDSLFHGSGRRVLFLRDRHIEREMLG